MKKKLTVLVALLLLVTVSVGGTLAWLATQTAPVTNTFTPSHVTTAVDEKINGSTKEKVSITNTGDTDAYLRATYVLNYVDADGNILPGTPDVNVIVNTTNWSEGSDGYYYSKVVVAPGDSLELFTDVTAGSGVQMTIIAEGIQSRGMGETVTTAQAAFAKAAE